MIPVFQTDRVAIVHGDVYDIRDICKPCSVDAVVTDGPYGIDFMGKKWDSSKAGPVFDPDVWAGVLEVLKPGGYLLSFGATRTYHRMGVAIEDAGFDIRDSIEWLYGTGFPKSLNVSKAIDKMKGAPREPDDYEPNHKNAVFGAGMGGGRTTIKGGPGSGEAAAWYGWGTGLKPAHEPIILAQRPRDGTYASNLLRWGVGALNIDACRIGATDDGRWPSNLVLAHADECVRVGSRTETVEQTCKWLKKGEACQGHPTQRAQSGVTFHEAASAEVETDVFACVPWCPVRQLDAQSGPSKSRKGKPRKGKAGDGWGMSSTGAEYNDAGGASRFFYCAKPTRKERDAGLDHLETLTGGAMTDRKDGSKGLDNPRAGAGRKGGSKNFHPTVKPTALMQYLCRLVTPPGGIVLDPFAGSGTTGIAALREGFCFVGVEREADYLPLIEGRIRHELSK